MSRSYPIISITGSSGAGTTSVKKTFENIFRREKVAAAYVEGDAFHRYNRFEMRTKMARFPFLKTLDQVWMNGGDVVDRTYLPTKATFTGPKVQEVYQFQYDLVHKYGISPDRALTNPNLGGLVAMS